MDFKLSNIIEFVKQKNERGRGDGDETPTVLVVDDEESLADMYVERLSMTGDYEVIVAYGGEEALEKAPDSDVVLLDRRMPHMSGDEVLKEIRERELGCQIVMVTAVEPDVDIVDMDFDHYVVKPLSEEMLPEIVEYVLARNSLDSKLQEYYSLSWKKDMLEEEMTRKELEENERYQKLEDELEKIHGEVEELHAKIQNISPREKDN